MNSALIWTYLHLVLNFGNAFVLIFGWVLTKKIRDKYKITQSRQLLNSLPGVWTSLGLLGTFIAICWSLSGIDIPQGGDSQVGHTVEEAMKTAGGIDIIGIISDLIPAFTSSIIGLCGALYSTYKTKMLYAEEDKLEEAATTSPENCLIRAAQATEKSAEAVKGLIEGLSEVKQSIDDQSIAAEQYNQTLNENLQQQNEVLRKFIDDFVSRMDDIFTTMHGRIEEQIEAFSQEQFTKSSAVLNEVVDKMNSISNEMLSNQTESVQKMIDDTAQQLNEISSQMTTMVESMTNSSTILMEKLTSSSTQALEKLTQKQSSDITEIVEKFKEMTGTMVVANENFVEDINMQMSAEYQRMQERHAETISQMASMQAEYQTMCSDIVNGSTTSNKEMLDALRTSISGFVDSMQQAITSNCNSLSDAIRENVIMLQDSYKFISDHIAEIKFNYQQSTEAFTDAVNGAHRVNELAEKSISHSETSLDLVTKNNETMAAIAKTMQGKQEDIEKLAGSINEMSDAIENLQKLESLLNKIANKVK